MRIIKVECDKKPFVKEITDELEDLQREVEGDIECVYPFSDEIGLIVNEEGKLNGMPLNRALRDEKGHPYDIIAGPFVIVGLTEDSFCSLSDEQIETYSKKFETPDLFFKVNGKIHVFPLTVES